MGDGVRDAAEHPALHALVADHEQIRAALGCESHQHLARIALCGARLAFDSRFTQLRLGPLENLPQPSSRAPGPLKLDVPGVDCGGASRALKRAQEHELRAKTP